MELGVRSRSRRRRATIKVLVWGTYTAACGAYDSRNGNHEREDEEDKNKHEEMEMGFPKHEMPRPREEGTAEVQVGRHDKTFTKKLDSIYEIALLKPNRGDGAKVEQRTNLNKLSVFAYTKYKTNFTTDVMRTSLATGFGNHYGILVSQISVIRDATVLKADRKRTAEERLARARVFAKSLTVVTIATTIHYNRAQRRHTRNSETPTRNSPASYNINFLPSWG